MAIRIEERGGRKYGYGHNTVSALQAAHDEYFDLAWLSARTEVNKRMQKQSRKRTQRKRFDMPMFLITIAVFCMVVTVFIFCKVSAVWSMLPMAATIALMSASGLTSDYYYREDNCMSERRKGGKP